MTDMTQTQPRTVRNRPTTGTVLRWLAIAAGIAGLAFLPYVFTAAGHPFLLDALVRMIILAIAAVSLNFLVFTAGLVSFGHAVFFGIGAYAVGISDHYGISNGFFHLAAAITVSGLYALLTGLVVLRTKGVHFLMITLAFSQIVYYIMLGLEEYGGDDGLIIYDPSAFPLLDLGDRLTLYWVAIAVLFAQIFFFVALNRSRFGLVLSAAKGSERRVISSGLHVRKYRLVAYVLSGMLTSLAGVLSANLTGFITPQIMDWMRSGELLFVVTLGGMGTALAPLTGSALFIFLEEILSSMTVYWHFWFGLFLIVAVMFGGKRFMSLVFTALRRTPK
ncbi:branched-chain amino acid ABC transporter permease [Halodurantibacterium flavum]|uniref:Branched-chain amino acid ABC transporter permease n=1 Tax=Halodurantibacterium flavum TaxID=1382802 RepID=A0ABW4S2Q1_9RHOB